MKLRIKTLEGFSKTYLPLRFQAYWNDEGYCFLRVQIVDGKIIILCAQLLNYHNTSVTNAVENVREAVLNALLQDGALKIHNQKNIFDLFRSEERTSSLIDLILFDYLNENSVWIEHYNAQVSINDQDRYSKVTFTGNYDPCWFPVTKVQLEKEFPAVDFSIDTELLENWRNARLSTDAIKRLVKTKNWTMKEIAERWNRSESWMSQIVNDEERELYWEDAFKGLPTKS
ncbi:hypothetical protein BH012_09870 [Salmonella enterica]|nr:hypothetical protein [Salmonella enterica]EAX6601628.1 hypothetical protein [Salmonella enterica]